MKKIIKHLSKQEEEILFDKLHQNFWYRGGFLIKKRGNLSKRIFKEKIFCFERKRYYLWDIIYLMHHKIFPYENLEFLDMNNENYKIENLFLPPKEKIYI